MVVDDKNNDCYCSCLCFNYGHCQCATDFIMCTRSWTFTFNYAQPASNTHTHTNRTHWKLFWLSLTSARGHNCFESVLILFKLNWCEKHTNSLSPSHTQLKRTFLKENGVEKLLTAAAAAAVWAFNRFFFFVRCDGWNLVYFQLKKQKRISA